MGLLAIKYTEIIIFFNIREMINNGENHVELHNSEIEISEIISYSTDDVEYRDSVPDKTWIMLSSLGMYTLRM